MQKSLKLMLAIQFVIILNLILVLFDIPFATQIIGFIFLSIIPGFLLLRILKINVNNIVYSLLLSIGLSIAFLMFVGLLINIILPYVGISDPLSTIPLLITISSITFLLSLMLFRQEEVTKLPNIPGLRRIVTASIMLGIPILAIFGASFTSTPLLLLMVIAIIILVILSLFLNSLKSLRFHSFILLIIALSLLLQKEFISNYFVGWDVFGEYNVFQVTQTNFQWNPIFPFNETALSLYNSMLSVTVLPQIYSSLLMISGELVFKFIYLLIFSLVPVILYQAYNEKYGKSIAFLSVFYFILFPRFIGLASRRQMIAELFLALIILLLLSKRIAPIKRKILLLIFAAALIVSHYSIAYIFLFSIFFTWVLLIAIEKRGLIRWDVISKKNITGGFLLSILIILVLWYLYVSPTPIQELLRNLTNLFSSIFTDFFNPESRGHISGIFTVASNLQLFNSIISKFVYIFIGLGFIKIFWNYKQKDFDWEYGFMVTANVLLVILVIVVPFLAPTLLADRFFHVALFYLAPISIIGGKTFFESLIKIFYKPKLNALNISRRIKRIRNLSIWLLSIYLIVIFLFNIGFIYELAGDVPSSRSISFMRMKNSDNAKILADFYNGYTPKQDVYGAVWLSKVMNNNFEVIADYTSAKQVLRGYGLIHVFWRNYLSNDTVIPANTYLYLRTLNLKGIIIGRSQNVESIDYQNLTKNVNKIYSNGATEIYMGLPSNP